MSHLDPVIDQLIDQLSEEADLIPETRLEILGSLTDQIRRPKNSNAPVRLHFICTHNSRRSQMAQIWAHTAVAAFQVPHVECYSGGTEATGFHPNAVRAMRTLGFRITADEGSSPNNPRYRVAAGTGIPDLICYSKRFEDAISTDSTFVAVMTCSDADQNCPVVPGAVARIPLTYEDPKASDGSGNEQQEYLRTAVEIGREIIHAFRRV
ncbi:MAG: protein-tyrosine-phosphatase [Cyclonatronaceae bacterium]